nr:hypothetical protein [Tanacetum cinerariifolium]
HREDRPPNSKFFPGSFNLDDYDNSRDYKQTRDYGRANVPLLTLEKAAFKVSSHRKPAISDLGWPFTPSHKSSPYFATYVGSVLQGLLELSSTCSWLDRSVSGQIGRTRRFHLWKAPTPNGLSRYSHFLADPSCKRRFRGKPAISDLGWPFTPSHKSSSYFATYVGSLLQGLLELSSTCSWLDRSVLGQIGRTRRFHLWKAPTPNGLSSCSHFLADPSCKRFREKPAISDLGWPFTPSHKSSSYFTTYVGSVLQGLLELSSTYSWLDRSVSGQIGRTRRFHLWKAPTPNGLSRCSHFLVDPSCKRCTFSRREEDLIEDIALERDTKSLLKIEREAIPVRYWQASPQQLLRAMSKGKIARIALFISSP